jgi:transcriptional regulatory protein LevR
LEQETEKKLQLLYQVGKLTDDDLKFVHYIDSYLSEYLHEEDVQDEMLLIHISVALDRVHNQQAVEAMPNDIWNQVLTHDQYVDAKRIWDNLKNSAPIKLPDSEVRYALMHIENVIGSD